MKKFLNKLWHKFRARMDWECPKCGADMIEVYHGYRCTSCDYRNVEFH